MCQLDHQKSFLNMKGSRNTSEAIKSSDWLSERVWISVCFWRSLGFHQAWSDTVGGNLERRDGESLCRFCTLGFSILGQPKKCQPYFLSPRYEKTAFFFYRKVTKKIPSHRQKTSILLCTHEKERWKTDAALHRIIMKCICHLSLKR